MAYFALPAAAFPAPHSAVRSHIEPNRRIHQDNVLHFGAPFQQEGRMSGYFMEALEGRRSSPRSDTSYLVSLFPTTERASAAFAEQRYYWDALTSHGGSVELPLRDGAYGDPDHEGLYAVRLPTDGSLAELLFARGPILVEVFQQVHAAHPSHTEVRAFYDIGTRLDIIARSRTWYPEVRDDPWRSAASCLCDDTAGGMRKQAPTCGR
jgi:hypothetical protein